MGRGRSGQLTLLLGIGGLVALASAGAVFFLGFEEFVTVLVDNLWTILGAIFFVGVIAIAVINAAQDEPNTRRDIGGLIGLLVVFILVFLFLPSASGVIQGYEADLTVRAHNPLGGPTEIRSVTVDNFRTVGPFTIIPPVKTFGIFADDLQATAVIMCNGEQRDKRTFSMVVAEGGSEVTTVPITNLPSGSQCMVDLTLGEDEFRESFQVPS